MAGCLGAGPCRKKRARGDPSSTEPGSGVELDASLTRAANPQPNRLSPEPLIGSEVPSDQRAGSTSLPVTRASQTRTSGDERLGTFSQRWLPERPPVTAGNFAWKWRAIRLWSPSVTALPANVGPEAPSGCRRRSHRIKCTSSVVSATTCESLTRQTERSTSSRSVLSTRPAGTPRRPTAGASCSRPIPILRSSTTSPAAKASPAGRPMRSTICGRRSTWRSAAALSRKTMRTSIQSATIPLSTN